MTGTWQCGEKFTSLLPKDVHQMTFIISYFNSIDKAAPTPIISIENSCPVQGWIQDFSYKGLNPKDPPLLYTYNCTLHNSTDAVNFGTDLFDLKCQSNRLTPIATQYAE